MIFRESQRFIFVHIPKTGGTSIEATLSQYFLGKNLPELTVNEACQYALPKRGTGLQHLKLFQYEKRYNVHSDEFFSFAFVRNPWDLVASEIRYFQKYEQVTFNRPTFLENVRILVNYKGALWGHDFSPQYNYLRNKKGRFGVSFLGRFETLQTDFDKVSACLGIEARKLPEVFTTSHGHPHYSQIYDDESRELVSKHFALDIEAFNYLFEESPARMG